MLERCAKTKPVLERPIIPFFHYSTIPVLGLPSFLLHVFQMHQTIRAAHEFADALHAEPLQDSHEFLSPCEKKSGDSLRPPFQVYQDHEFRVRGRDAPCTAPAA